MKKVFLLLLAVVVVFSFVGCGDKREKNSTVDTYKNAALKYVKEGNYEAAVKVLEIGIEKTHDDVLKQLLEKTKEKYLISSVETNEEIVELGGTESAQLEQTPDTMGTLETEPSTTDSFETEPLATDILITEPPKPKFDIKNYLGEWKSESADINIKMTDYSNGVVEIAYSESATFGANATFECARIDGMVSFSVGEYGDYTIKLRFENEKIIAERWYIYRASNELQSTEIFERYNSANYTLDISSYVENNWGVTPYCNEYLKLYIIFEAGMYGIEMYGIDMRYDAQSATPVFMVYSRDCDYRGVGIYLKADIPYGNTVTYKLKKVSDSQGTYYTYSPDGTEGVLMLSFVGNEKIYYKLANCNLDIPVLEGELTLE